MGKKDHTIAICQTARLKNKKTKNKDLGHLRLSLWLTPLPFIALIFWVWVTVAFCIFINYENLILQRGLLSTCVQLKPFCK